MLTALTFALTLLAPQAPDGFPEDGHRVSRPGIPGTLCVYGEDAKAVLTSGGKHPKAVAAVAQYGKGRVFGIAHDGYRAASHFEKEDGLMRAALDWLLQGEKPGKVSLLTPHAGFEQTLANLGFEVVPFGVDGLAATQILFLSGEGPIDEATHVAISTWIQDGGSLCATLCPWGWKQVHGSKGWELTKQLTANRILAPAGMQFTDGYADAKVDGMYVVDRATCAQVNCSVLVEQLESRNPPKDLTPLEDALRFLPLDDVVLLPRLEKVLPKLDEDSAPKPDHALKAKEHPLERLAVIAQHRRLQASSPANPMKTPGAEVFPGVSKGAPKSFAKVLSLDPSIPGWQSTGLYLDPGKVLQVASDANLEGWQVRIGAHADRLWHKDRWPRWPEASVVQPLKQEVQAASGGLIYFIADAENAAPIRVTLSGAVPAPHWVSGQTSDKEWRRIRKEPAPWAELQGKYLILTLPSTAIRKLDNPQELMDWWDTTVAEQFTLAGEPLPQRPERFVSDVLISAGYMHAGYPIMMHLDVAEPRVGKRPAVLVDLEELQDKGNWGCFHELGHNRQKPAWTFGGTGEVTNNLFSLHSGEVMSGIEPWQNPWLQNQKMAGRAYLRDGADFNVWKRKPGIALLCYAQIQKHFGWEPFRQTFAAARDLPAGERPNNDDAKRSFWVRQMSHACGQDLRAFHAHWGWPLEPSLEQDAALDALPKWMPDFSELE
ncbi:MAG: M60 family metallopeptidase [Planctomycetota bacterium]